MPLRVDQLSHQLPVLPFLPAVVVGLFLLFLGRKLFWLFVAAVGFAVGADAASVLFRHQPDWWFIIGLILGLIGAVTAICMQKIAVGIAGFLAGGYFLMSILRTWQIEPPGTSWVFFFIGGVVGALLMYSVFNWALIILSSIIGAHFVMLPFVLAPLDASAAFGVLAIVGIMAQGKMLSVPRTERS